MLRICEFIKDRNVIIYQAEENPSKTTDLFLKELKCGLFFILNTNLFVFFLDNIKSYFQSNGKTVK